MLNLFDKKTKNSPLKKLKFFSVEKRDVSDNNNINEARHYPPATKE